MAEDTEHKPQPSPLTEEEVEALSERFTASWEAADSTLAASEGSGAMPGATPGPVKLKRTMLGLPPFAPPPTWVDVEITAPTPEEADMFEVEPVARQKTLLGIQAPDPMLVKKVAESFVTSAAFVDAAPSPATAVEAPVTRPAQESQPDIGFGEPEPIAPAAAEPVITVDTEWPDEPASPQSSAVVSSIPTPAVPVAESPMPPAALSAAAVPSAPPGPSSQGPGLFGWGETNATPQRHSAPPVISREPDLAPTSARTTAASTLATRAPAKPVTRAPRAVVAPPLLTPEPVAAQGPEPAQAAPREPAAIPTPSPGTVTARMDAVAPTPIAPIAPSAAIAPSAPIAPSAASAPIAPSAPVEPKQPAFTDDPTLPTGVAPSAPIAPSAASAPIAPSAPVEPKQPAFTDDPTLPTGVAPSKAPPATPSSPVQLYTPPVAPPPAQSSPTNEKTIVIEDSTEQSPEEEALAVAARLAQRADTLPPQRPRLEIEIPPEFRRSGRAGLWVTATLSLLIVGGAVFALTGGADTDLRSQDTDTRVKAVTPEPPPATAKAAPVEQEPEPELEASAADASGEPLSAPSLAVAPAPAEAPATTTPKPKKVLPVPKKPTTATKPIAVAPTKKTTVKKTAKPTSKTIVRDAPF